ncbi:copper resistance CopC/CopD family protein [Paenisporosarcina antarctica]|uniref:CopC domain-containing protein n=1 Tax=Paenisporosarcina antarctica TaxID=417367 RepID=A0A4P6ZZT4_9BACL|nr:copper resistance protein CopC [Paenisporosarcina antarctica]QBP41798.1 hypothetical protein E2636_11850 [Paenisporosarcina antarctica]
MKTIILILCVTMSLFTYTTNVDAHADLASSSPVDGAVLKTLPNEVVLTFSTTIDNQVYKMDAQNEQGESVINGESSINPAGDELSISLLDTTDGLVTVTYSVISKDGHPIEGIISFTIETEEQLTSSETEEKLSTDASSNGTSENKQTDTPTIIEPQQQVPTKSLNEIDEQPSMDMVSLADKMEFTTNKTATPLSSIIKSAYLLALLVLTGSLLWRFKGYKIPYLAQMQLIHLVMLALFTWSQARNFTRVFEGIPWQDLFLQTEVGQFWTAAIIITVLGLYIVGRNRYVDLAWLSGILIIKSLNSHAIATQIPIVTVSLNFIHLLFSALWIAGLFYVILLWKKSMAQPFISTFSKMALLSIIILTITGSIYAWLLAPSLSSLWTTEWGYWLITKIVAVIGVFILGSLIRQHMKKTGSLSKRSYLFFDSALAIIILIIVGVLTQLSSSI